MPTLSFYGKVDSTPENTDLARALGPGTIRPKYGVQIAMDRSASAPRTVDVADDDLVELELDGGIRLWTRADDLKGDLAGWTRRGPAADSFEIPQVLPLGTPSRGVGQWVIKGLKILGVDMPSEITDLIREKVESVLKPGAGLYRCGGASPDDLSPVELAPADQPLLVFIHGTASTTGGSFGGLWENAPHARISDLLKLYEGRVLAFQHRTLTESPIENALELAKALPNGARLHLVSHSRGGLVGELLCRGMLVGRAPFEETELKLFDGPGRQRDRAALQQLQDILASRQLRVERFIRVACPTRGTTLAGGRLDRFLSIVVNVLERAPGMRANPVFDAVSALLLAVVKNRTDPRELPGLEAMMPEAPLIRVLNRPGLDTGADLHVLGGDLAGEGMWSRLKALVTDLFYREDHDLVVNTPSMFGGASRTAGIRYWIDTGSKVDHFSYFRNDDTASRLLGGLAAADQDSYHLLEKPPYEVTEDDYRKRAVDSQPVVFVLPGLMGSHLKAGKSRVWLDICSLASGGLRDLQAGGRNVSPDGLVAGSYRELVRFLAQTHEVVPFAYDWRQSVCETAEALRLRIEEKLAKAEAGSQPVRIIAHAMGGLAVRAMLATPEGWKVWERMCRHPGARFIMLGTPNGGSHAITAMLMGRDALVRKLALVDIRHGCGELLEFFSAFAGVLQMLPHEGSLDAYDAATWRVLQQNGSQSEWPVPEATHLAEAARVRDLLHASPIDPDRMIYVAGCAAATPCDVTIDTSAPQGHRVVVHATAQGDGRVPWATGVPSDLKSKTYYMDVEHGDLANTSAAFPALLDLLNVGVTTKLPQTPPALRGASGETFELPVEAPAFYPDEEDLVASALGSTRHRRAAEPNPRVRVRVVHGNLSRAAYPVVVGHYCGDTIVSAEAYLDWQLDNRLREMQRLDLYPGELNTSAVFLNEEGRRRSGAHPGAIVVGLGTVGSLTPGGLAGSFSRAATAYAMGLIDSERAGRRQAPQAPDGEGRISAAMAALLIGTGGAGLTVTDSLQSILRGVTQANQHLQSLQTKKPASRGGAPGAPDGASKLTAFIDQLDIIELWQDRAIQAVKALLDLGRSAEFRDRFQIEELVVGSADGRKRAYYDEEPGWWQRMRISVQEDGALKFEGLTERARAESYLQPTQRRLVESFLERAVASTGGDADLGCTLFELLVPNLLKEHAPDRRNLVLVLDEQSAAYPWELMQDRFCAGARPLSVEAGMVRQLAVPVFREKVLQATRYTALVVGDPTRSDKSGKYAPLPGAEAEARAVARQLRDHGYAETVELAGEEATAQSILTALYSRPYRILHVAGHGVFQFPVSNGAVPGETVSGIVLGDGLFLTPAEIEQMRFVPDVVFVNCCHLGQTRGEAQQDAVQYHRLAANIATQLIRIGVRCVVAAGWAVDDAAAGAFAATFYCELLEGRAFGEAVRLAREEIHLRFGATNTWGAYQCYGDPDFSLNTGAAAASRTPRSNRIVAPAELLGELEDLVQSSRSAGLSGQKSSRQRLAAVVKSVPRHWLAAATTCAALGDACFELDMFEEGLRYYELARTCEPADAPVDSLDRMAALEVRWAAQLIARLDSVSESAADQELRHKPGILLEKASRLLDGLSLVRETRERHSLRGRLGKLRATLARNPASCRKHLEIMASSYREAFREDAAPMSARGLYLKDQLVAEIVLGWRKPARGSDRETYDQRLERIGRGLEDLERLAGVGQNADEPWSLRLAADHRLLSCLRQQAISEQAGAEIRAGYLAAVQQGSPACNVTEDIAFLEKMAQAGADATHRRPLVAALAALRQAIS